MQNKKLAIFDLDNTLTDAFALWHHVTDTALDLISNQFGIDRRIALAGYKAAPEQYRFADFEKIIDWMDAGNYLPKAVSGEDQYRKDVTKIYIREQVRKARTQMSGFYTDALETLHTIEAAKTDIAIYTDAEASPTIQRLWLMARNAGGDPLDTLNLIGHIYCKPSFECDSVSLREIDPEFILSVKSRMTLWADRIGKPAPTHTQLILNDFGVQPGEAVMIGDSYKDGGCAVPLGVDFIWYRKGAICTPEAAITVESICDPGWNYGEAYMRSRFNETSKPGVTIDDMRHMLPLFTFGPGNGFKSSGDAPSIHRVEPQFHLMKRYAGIGPPTHL